MTNENLGDHKKL